MGLEHQVAEIIMSRKRPGKRFVVAVCGAADLGKSYLSEKIVREIQRAGNRAAHLPMDSFLMDRACRTEKGLSGYQPGACDLKAVLHQVIRLKDGKDIAYSPYDHHTGAKTDVHHTIRGAGTLIVEGLHAMHRLLMPHIGLSIFLYTADARLKKIRQEADIVKRKQTREFSRRAGAAEFQQYKRWVASYQADADLCLYLEKQWQYHIEFKNIKGRQNLSATLETERLVLRPLARSDLDAMVETIMSDKAVMHWLPYSDEAATPEGQEEVARGYLDSFVPPWRERGYGIWAICLKERGMGEPGTFIGYCGFLPEQLEGAGPEMAYALGQAYWGKGLVTEAASACLNWIFTRTDVHRIHAVTDRDNYASQNVMAHIGMRHVKDVDLYNSVAKGNGLLPLFGIERKAYMAAK